MVAVEKITNGGFELGDLTGWTHNEAPNHAIIIDEPGDIYEGDYCLNLNNVSAGYGSWISQDLSGSVINTDDISTFRIAMWFFSGIVPNDAVLDVTLTYSDLSTSVEHLIPTTSWVLQNINTMSGKILTGIKIQLVDIDQLGQVFYIDGISLMYNEPQEASDVKPAMKEKLLIISGDTSHDDELDNAGAEAKRYVVMRVTEYNDAFDPDTIDVVGILNDIRLNLACFLFKKRHMPQDQDSAGDWSQGIRKLNEYLKANYLLATPKEIADIDKIEAETDLLTSELTKITAENAVLTQEVLNLQADVIHLTALNGNLTAINSKLSAETTKIGGVDTTKETAEEEFIDVQKAKMSGVDSTKVTAESGLINAQTTKLAGADTDNVEADTGIKDARALIIPKEGDKLDAEVDVLTAELTRMAADLTKITSENALSAQEILRLQAIIINLTAQNVNLVAQNTKMAAETADIIEKTTQIKCKGVYVVGQET